MKKILLVVLICSINQSCTVIDLVSNIPLVNNIQSIKKDQKESIKNNSQTFVYSENRILLPSIVNGEKDTLLFDTGYNGDFIRIENNTEPIKDSCFKLKVSSHYSRDKIFVKLLRLDLENDLMKWTKHIGMETYVDVPCYSKQYPVLGVASLDTVKVLINFDEGRISIYEDTCEISESYLGVRSSFENNIISLFLKVDSSELKCIFDTGSPINLLKMEHYNKEKINDIIYEGLLLLDIKGMNFDQTNILSKLNFCINNYNHLESEVMFASDIKDNIIGMSFISKFNWIIDYKNKMVYLSPRNSIKEEKFVKKYLYGTMVINDKLIVSTRNKTANSPLKIKSVVISVNGELINNDNICYYMNLLNANSDWSELNVEIE